MTRVRMLKLAAGPEGVLPAGAEVSLPDEVALAYIDAGAAERVVLSQVETATLPAAEQRPKRRKEKATNA